MCDKQTNIPIATIISINNSQTSHDVIYAEHVSPDIINDNLNIESLEIVVLPENNELFSSDHDLNHLQYYRICVHIVFKGCCLLICYVFIIYFMLC